MKPFNTGLIQTGWNARITDQFQNTPDLGVSRRGRRILDKLVASKQASPEAVQAMLNLVDPFPDSALEAVGWPDATGCPSVSFVDKEEISISAPAGTTSSWNFHVAFSPYLTNTSLLGALFNWLPDGTISGGGSFVGTRNLWNVFTWKDADQAPDPTGTNPAYRSYVSDSIPPNSMVRVCATGVEAVNTSTALYRGGYQYAYRTKSQARAVAYSPPVPAGSATPMTAWYSTAYNAPPKVPADIVNMANTFSGSAENGCVVVNTPQSFAANEYIMSGPRFDIISAVPPNAFTAKQNGYAAYWNNAGIFVTGLAPQATFTLKFRTFLEATPLDLSSVTAALSKPGVAHSPVIEEIIASILRDMPAGFDYRENPFGEWFMKILDTVANVAPAIGTALSPVFPPAAMLGHGVGGLARAVSGTVTHVRKTKAEKKLKKFEKNLTAKH